MKSRMKSMLLMMALAATGGAAIAQTAQSPTAMPTPQASATATPLPGATPIPNPAVVARRGAIMQACQADIQTYCTGMVLGDGKLGKCIRENRAKLSTPCQTALQSLRGGAAAGQPPQ